MENTSKPFDSLEQIPETPADPDAILSDEQLAAGGLVPVKAFMRSKASANALRVKKHREKAEGEGIKQINVQAPEDAREVIKAIAERTKAGEAVAQVLAELAGKDAGTAPENAPQALPPGGVTSSIVKMAAIGDQVLALTGWRKTLARIIGLPV